MIFPLVSNDTPLGKACNSGGCHAPGAVQPDFSTFAAFDKKFRAKPGESARVVIHGQHRGPALTDKSKATIIAWINGLPDGALIDDPAGQ
ncbi:MAG: hypothetical protein ABIY55_03325 [Kofleriaceae bacterium]